MPIWLRRSFSSSQVPRVLSTLDSGRRKRVIGTRPLCMFDIKETAAGETTFRASATYFGEICFSPFQPSPDSDHGPNLSSDMTGPSSKLIFYALEIVICPNVGNPKWTKSYLVVSCALPVRLWEGKHMSGRMLMPILAPFRHSVDYIASGHVD